MEESISVIQELADYSCIFLIIFNNVPPLFSPSPDQRNVIFKSFYDTANSEAAKEKNKKKSRPLSHYTSLLPIAVEIQF